MSQIKPIKTEADHKRVVNRIQSLIEMDEATMPQHLSDELSVLATLLEAYEAIHFPIEKADPVSIIEFHMDQRGITRSDLKSCIGSAKKVSEVLKGKRPLTLKMIRTLDKNLNIPAELLIDHSKTGIPKNDQNIDWDKFPVSELASKGFLKDRRDPKDYSEELMRELISDAGGEENIPVPLFRKSSSTRQNSKTDIYALQAWCFFVLAEVRTLDLDGKYKPGIVEKEFLRTVARLSTDPEGPSKAKAFLSQKGIALVYAPHLPKTFLDGAAMMTREGVPVVGMTIRYDRLDNFWFCLLHELAHIGWHLENGKGYFVDDFNLNNAEQDGSSEKESEADALAQNALIPTEIWDKFKNSKLSISDKVYKIAAEASVHPAVVAGRFRRETGNYQILSNLVGDGEVRRHFE